MFNFRTVWTQKCEVAFGYLRYKKSYETANAGIKIATKIPRKTSAMSAV